MPQARHLHAATGLGMDAVRPPLGILLENCMEKVIDTNARLHDAVEAIEHVRGALPAARSGAPAARAGQGGRRHFMAGSLACLLGATLALSGCSTTAMHGADSPAKRQQIDQDVNATLSRLYTAAPGSRELVRKARGVLVFPSVLAAGFMVGGEYGEGALRVHGRTEGYYSTVSGSFGLQAGAQSKAVVFLFMTEQALDKFRNSQGWTAGVDASVAIIKAGANGNIDLNTATKPVSVIVMTNAGLMANLNIEGTKVTPLKTSRR